MLRILAAAKQGQDSVKRIEVGVHRDHGRRLELMEDHVAEPRQRALDLLATFEDRHLLGLLRRIAAWKGHPLACAAQLLDDVRQELALDCLENAAEIVELTHTELRQRWFRRVQTVQYRLFGSAARMRGEIEDPDILAAPGASPAEVGLELDPADRMMVFAIARDSVHLKNGRLNAEATAERLGITVRALQRLGHRIAAWLGVDARALGFWRRRLAEALVAYAAASLRGAGRVTLAQRAERHRADPAACRQRIARIRAALRRYPLPADMRTAMRSALRRDPVEPDTLLEHATLLEPDLSSPWLWSFEVAVLRGELRDAARCLRRAARRAAPRVPLVLARARLCEARRGRRAAAQLLDRAVRRADDPRLRESLVACLSPG